MTPKNDFHFPEEIKLKKNSLAEAWLEVRWKLKSTSPLPPSDPDFPLALGVFRNSIKDNFKETIRLPLADSPFDEMLPYTVRYQFWKKKDTWPVIQIGPGIATVNFTSPYSWTMFRKKAVYLKEKLDKAYSDLDFSVSDLFLRYRNAIEFDFKSSDILDYFEGNLNTHIRLPLHIPGKPAKPSWPTDISNVFTYDLVEPLGKGVIRIGTGQKKQDTVISSVVVFELEVQSKNNKENNIWNSSDVFQKWLDDAHSVIHEWFFSLIDGPLKKEYERKE